MSIAQILYVHNEPREKKQEILNLIENDFEVVPASTTEKALGYVRIDTPDLIMCNINLPDGDADNLIQSLKTSLDFQEIPISVMLKEPQPEDEARLRRLGASGFVYHNDSARDYLTTVKEMINLHRSSKAENVSGITGQLARMGIIDLIRQLAADHGSGIISIDGQVTMEIVLRNGAIIHAKHGITVGKKALFRCLRIAEAAYHFKRQNDEIEPTIEGDLHSLIEEARLTNQRLMANFHRLPQSHHRIKIIYSDELRTTNLRAEARAALEVIKRHPRVKDYLDYLNLPDTICYEYLLTFKERNFIDFITEQRPVALIVDSSCDLGTEHLESMGIGVVPLKIMMDRKEITDHPRNLGDLFSLKPKQYARVELAPTMDDLYLNKNREFISTFDCLNILPSDQAVPIHRIARRQLKKLSKEGLNGQPLMANELMALRSTSLSLGVGLLVRRAIALIEDGHSIESIYEKLERAKDSLHVMFAVVPGKSQLAPKANASNIFVWRGESFQAIERATDEEEIRESLLQQLQLRIDPRSRLQLAVGHVNNSWQANKLRDHLEQSNHASSASLHELGPITGRWLGEGALELAFLQV